MSFIGNDDSSFIFDERTTYDFNNKPGNKCRIELAFSHKETTTKFKNSPHFKECVLLSGHFTSALDELFPKYSMQYFTILREPTLRTISNIIQFTRYKNGSCYFAGYEDKSALYSRGYWEWIYHLLRDIYPIKTLSIHENLFLSDCQTRIVGGAKYLSLAETPSIKLALDTVRDKNIKISFFEDFNRGLQKSLNYYNIPLDMERLNPAGKDGIPYTQSNKQERFGPYYGAPKKIVEWIKEMNAKDLVLYKKLKRDFQR